MQYIQKLERVDAIQYDGTNIEEIKNLTGKNVVEPINNISHMKEGTIVIELDTYGCIMEVSIGDYIVKYIDGHFCRMEKDTFESMYEMEEE